MKILNFKRNTALLLIIAILLSAISLVSCGRQKGEAVMTLGDSEVSVNMYRLWLSRVKGAYGGSDSSIWDQTDENGKTYNEIFTEYVIQNVKTFLCALYLFDELDLSLPKEQKKKVEQTMKDILEKNADGSKATLNTQLASFGVNYDILKEIYLVEAKLSYLQDYLYGENGTEKISDETKQQYYGENYVRIKQIFFYTANKPLLDENGKYIYDENGQVITRDYTEEEIAEQKSKANAALEKLNGGVSFDSVISEYSEDPSNSEYQNGYYFTKTSQYVDEVINAAFEMQEDSYKIVYSDYGIHIIKRLALDDGGYALSQNEDFFTNFEENIQTQTLTQRLKRYEENISFNQELISAYDIKSSNSNTIY